MQARSLDCVISREVDDVDVFEQGLACVRKIQAKYFWTTPGATRSDVVYKTPSRYQMHVKADEYRIQSHMLRNTLSSLNRVQTGGGTG